MAYGLMRLETRGAAYTFAKANNVNIPETWHRNEMAGDEWLKLLRRRHPNLSLKKPEACSLSRATSFNRHNVQNFFENLKGVIAENPALGEGVNIYNLDEIALTTVHTPTKVLTNSTQRRLNEVTSGERGTLVTACLIVRADGTFIPPAMMFPRAKFKKHMTNGAPVGTLGLAAKTGWMNGELFYEVMEHFIKFTNSSPSHNSLLIEWVARITLYQTKFKFREI